MVKLICLLLIVFQSIGCSFLKQVITPLPTPTSVPTPFSTPQINIEDIKFSSVIKGVKQWEIRAKSIRGDKKKVYLEEVHCDMFKQNEVVLKIVAKNGEVDFENKNISFKGKILGRGKRGEMLQMDKLFWDNQKQELIGEGNVVFRSRDWILTGDKIKVDLLLKKYSVEGNIKAEFILEEK